MPKYVEVFLQRVAKAAHSYARFPDGYAFNMSKFNKECRKLLYNTERNDRPRNTAENKSVSAAKPAVTTPPARSAGPDRDDSTLPDDCPQTLLRVIHA